jgi:hypothetical protein
MQCSQQLQHHIYLLVIQDFAADPSILNNNT